MSRNISDDLHPTEYKELLAIWQNQNFVPPQIDYWYYMKFNPGLAKFLQQSPSVSWIFDLRHLRFDFVSKNSKEVLGYEPELFKEKGLDFCNQIKHPEDLSRSWKLLKKVWEYIMEVPPAEREHYKFNYDYRNLKPNGEEVRILEQNAVLQQDVNGNITHILGICNDITGWKNTDNQIASITSTKDDSIIFLMPDEPSQPLSQPILSKREIEIVSLLAQGYSSKQIADKLSISFHTVNTHRQHMTQKTGVKNTGELVSFAISNGLI